MRRPILASAFAGLALAALGSPAAADCPSSTYLYGATDPATPIAVVVPAQDTTFAIHFCDHVHGRYQVDAGLVLAAAYSGCAASGGPGPVGIETVLEDDFTVTGLPTGTPVTFDAVLELKGIAESFSAPWDGGGGRVRGLVREGSSHEVSLQRGTTPQGPLEVNEPLVLTISATAGVPVRLRFAVRGECMEGRAEMEGTFRFANLPAGAIVLSCRGYASDGVVPAHASSWGRLKSIYR